MSSLATSEYRRRRKANLIAVCGNQCNLCGYNKVISALEFHHINPKEKSYGIASQGTCHDLEQDLNEVKKCILVCSNCHREIHEDLYTLEYLYSQKIFDDNYANQLRQEKEELFIKKEYFCKNCGDKISRYSESGLCAKCYKLTTRIVIRPERDELKSMIRAMPFTQIAERYNVADNTIRKWCKFYLLPHKKTEINKITDEDWLNM